METILFLLFGVVFGILSVDFGQRRMPLTSFGCACYCAYCLVKYVSAVW